MPPKQLNDTCNSIHSSIATDKHSQSLYQNVMTPGISVDESLVKYQDNSQLLNHIMAAKAEEDKRRTAEEWCQAEETRLQSKLMEYELNQGHSSNQSFDNFLIHHQQNDSSVFEHPYFDQSSDRQSASTFNQSTSLNASPIPCTSTSEYSFIQNQETTSIASSSPSIDLFSPSASDMYYHQQNQPMSCSSFDLDDLSLYPCSSIFAAPIIPSQSPTRSSSGNRIKHRKSKSHSLVSVAGLQQQNKPKPARSSVNIHRTLSYENVMTLDGLKMNKKSDSSPSLAPASPAQPLDHDKVMEALRAKLLNPYPNIKRKSSPEPLPPPNTYPTTGVLLLNLKSRRRKSTATKHCSGSK